MKPITRVPFTAQEDEIIRDQFEKDGFLAFKKLAKTLKRYPRIIRDHYMNSLAPGIDHVFTELDDKKIIRLVNDPQIGRKWRTIASLMKGKSESMVKSRYDVLMRKLRRGEILEDGSRTENYTNRKFANHRKKSCFSAPSNSPIAPISSTCSNQCIKNLEVEDDFLNFVFEEDPVYINDCDEMLF